MKAETLRADPEFGPLFDDLDAALDDHPLPPPTPPPTPPPSSAWRRLASWAGSAGAIALLAWWLWPASEQPPQAPPGTAVTSGPLAELPDEPQPARPATELADSRAPPVAPPSTVRTAQPSSSPIDPPPPGDAPSDEALLDDVLLDEAVPTPPVVGILAEEERVYRPAEQALAAAEWDRALAAAEDYLTRFPTGRWVDKAQLLRLDALVGAHRYDDVAVLAQSLEEAPPFAARRTDLVRIHAEALAALERCPEALALVAGIPRDAAAGVRRTCR